MIRKYFKLNLVFIIILFFTSTTTIAEESSRDKAIEHARNKVEMLDDLYKTFMELITDEYVKDKSLLSAATISKKVFKIMEKKGWHETRLLDATGNPFNPDNNPKDEFERDAINALVWGNSYIEMVVKVEDKEYLRVATSLTAVTKGCILCHKDKKVGELLGAISYRIPLE